MSELKLEFVGKQVRDMYGTFMGKVVGIITDIDGSIEAVGIDCGSAGLKQLPYEQLLVQGDYVIFIPRWRLDAQKLLRQKGLTLKRLKALQDILSENDNMKEDAELVYIKYEKRLKDLEESERLVNEKLQERLNELDAELKSIKAVLFDAKLQYRSNEMTEETYQQVNMQTSDLMEHINLEKSEINNVRTRLSQQTPGNIASNNQNTPASVSSSQIPSPPPSSIQTENEIAPAESENTQYENKEVNTPQMLSAAGKDENAGNKEESAAGKDEKVTISRNMEETSWLNNVIPK